MSGPALARLDDAGDRFYTFGDPPESFWSVTTIISGGVPKYLHAHYAKMAAELAYGDVLAHGPNSRASAIARRWTRAGRVWVAERQAAGQLKSIKAEKLSDADLALRWLKGAADRHRDAAAELGSDVHDEAERLILEAARESARLYIDRRSIEAWPAGLEGHQQAFLNFLDDWHPEYIATEASVFNRREAYAGTLDALLRIHLPDGSSLLLLVDYKSGRAIYSEVALQLAAYRRGEFIGAPDGVTELELPTVDACAVLHLTPKGYRFRLVRTDDAVWDAFRYAREVYRWNKELAGTAFLQDLTPTHDPAPHQEVA